GRLQMATKPITDGGDARNNDEGSREHGGEKDLAVALPQDSHSIGTVKSKLYTAKLRSRLDKRDEGVLGVQDEGRPWDRNSLLDTKFVRYNMRRSTVLRTNSLRDIGIDLDRDDETAVEEEEKEVDVEDISYVRKPNLARMVQEYKAMLHRPKYTLKQVLLSRRFHLYAHRFANAQYKRTLLYPTLPQPQEFNPVWLCQECKEEEDEPVTEKQRTRPKGHRFIIAADTQFGSKC
ncbi:MAG: hypothetical protein ACPH86_06580, partial [Schleiferiaceae bacterium]